MKQKGKRKKDRKGRHVIVKKYKSFVKSKRIFWKQGTVSAKISVSLSHAVEEKEVKKDVQNGGEDDKSHLKGQLVQEEEREKGKVGFSVFVIVPGDFIYCFCWI